ncbi:MAG: hypothetical protein ACERKZ_05400 [Lachnotalea sp.]
MYFKYGTYPDYKTLATQSYFYQWNVLYAAYVGISEEKLAYELYLSKDQIKLMKKEGIVYTNMHAEILRYCERSEQ